MTKSLSSAEAFHTFDLGQRRYFTGVATMNDPYFMQPIHAVSVEAENKDRIAKWAYGSMTAGSFAVVKAALFNLEKEKREESSDRIYLRACLRLGHWQQHADKLAQSGHFGEAVARLKPKAFVSPDTFSLLRSELAVPLHDLMDGIGINPFFDDWEPERILPELGPGEPEVEQIVVEANPSKVPR